MIWLFVDDPEREEPIVKAIVAAFDELLLARGYAEMSGSYESSIYDQAAFIRYNLHGHVDKELGLFALDFVVDVTVPTFVPQAETMIRDYQARENFLGAPGESAWPGYLAKFAFLRGHAALHAVVGSTNGRALGQAQELRFAMAKATDQAKAPNRL